jgi:protein-S-isoprenylcysteine O-methyltransferase Ste14
MAQVAMPGADYLRSFRSKGPMMSRIAYAALFTVVLPAVLVLWAMRLDPLMQLPAYGSLGCGLALAVAGGALMAAGTFSLSVHGRGLPASPFPPERLVDRGIYRMAAHPIYLGAVVFCLGIALLARSPTGLWIVTPVLALAAAAFVVGFERDATRRRYGVAAAPLLRLPEETDAPPKPVERIAVYVLVFVPWLVFYEAVAFLGTPSDARLTYFGWELDLPVFAWTEAIYALSYLMALTAPIAANRNRDLREFSVAGLWATVLIFPVYLLVPWVAPAKPVPGDGFWQMLLRWERANDQAVTSFPAFHVVWTCLAARLYALRWPRLRWLWWSVCGAVAVSCLTTGMHSVADVAAGFVAYALIVKRHRIWRAVCTAAEAVAGSLRERTLGSVRLMSHGIYASVGAVGGLVVAVALAGRMHLGWLVAMSIASIAGAALWAQLVEGSSDLLRPYGYFGSVIGALAVGAASIAWTTDVWLLLVAFCVGATFTQAIGRLRCLVQGCCHGREAPPALGIRYTDPRSRVVRLSGLSGVSLHATPVYSMAWMILVGFLLLRLWFLRAPLAFILGVYFILVGIGRFVEEHFRGEPQTATIGGLRLYQWLAIGCVIGGAAVTTLESPPAPAPAGFEPSAFPILAVVGVVAYAAYGVDFPRSNRRFSRLR